MIIKKTKTISYEPVLKDNLAAFKKQHHERQQGICPILKKPMELSDAVVDHKHKKRKSDPIGKNGDGLIRGVIHNSVNRLEGKISGAYTRFGLQKIIPLPELLRNLADYLEKPPIEQKFIHPTEMPKTKIPALNKTEYNLLAKYWPEIAPRRKLPEFTPNKFLKYTDTLKLLEKANALHIKHKEAEKAIKALKAKSKKVKK